MPTYEYVCLDCGAGTEVRATVAEKAHGLAPRCGACEGAALRRAFTAVAVVGRQAGAAAPAPSGGGCCGGACGCG